MRHMGNLGSKGQARPSAKPGKSLASSVGPEKKPAVTLAQSGKGDGLTHAVKHLKGRG